MRKKIMGRRPHIHYIPPRLKALLGPFKWQRGRSPFEVRRVYTRLYRLTALLTHWCVACVNLSLTTHLILSLTLFQF
jgi:hypothetical protein